MPRVKVTLAAVKTLPHVEDAWQEESDSFMVRYRPGWVSAAEGTTHDTAESLAELMRRARDAERQ